VASVFKIPNGFLTKKAGLLVLAWRMKDAPASAKHAKKTMRGLRAAFDDDGGKPDY